MFLRMFYDDDLAQASYLIGCEDAKKAIVLDPLRDVDRYIDFAASHKMQIVAAADTHVHADFVSGCRELAHRVGAHIYASAAGGDAWTPSWLAADGVAHTLLNDGDEFEVGPARFRAVHSPGHTPEHMSYEVTDAGSGADEPMGVITGDFVFVGDLGRPDLLEEAVGVVGTREPAARELCASARWFDTLPDYLQVWPGHGSGSACGKSMGAVPQSTVGYERRHNPALMIADDEIRFIEQILEGQPEPPTYFARMKRVNVEGPPVVGKPHEPPLVGWDSLPAPDSSDAVLVDLRPWEEFCAGHRPGSLSAPLDDLFTVTMGSYIEPGQKIYLLGDRYMSREAVRRLSRIGLDNLAGCVRAADMPVDGLEMSSEVSVDEVRSGESPVILDVRKLTEHADGHAPGAPCLTHVQLVPRLEEVPRGNPVYVMCRTGRRSARAVSLLQREGFRAVNVAGGFHAWRDSGAPVER